MGPLTGYTIIEIAGIGPGPYAGMLLADMGAEVIRIERPGGSTFHLPPEFDFMNRNKSCLVVDLKQAEGVEVLKRLAAEADVVFEGNRPGVAERLGIGPADLMPGNSKLVYGRITGWGQDGPLANTAGHDINYIALAGALYPIGRKGEKPSIPLTLVGDFAGGGQTLAYGIVCALLECSRSGKGQIVDTAMIDGVSSLMTSMFSSFSTGFWSEQRGTNILDSGAPFYEVYECADAEFICVGAIEAKFYQAFLCGLGLDETALPMQMDQSRWHELEAVFSATILTKTRDQWLAIFAGTDACVAPVLKLSEVGDHQHHQARQSFVEVDGHMQPQPSPRFSRTKATVRHGAKPLGADTTAILSKLGLDEGKLRKAQIVF